MSALPEPPNDKSVDAPCGVRDMFAESGTTDTSHDYLLADEKSEMAIIG